MPKCSACDAESVGNVETLSCENCRDLIGATTTVLKPDALESSAMGFSKERLDSIRGARWIAKRMIEASQMLASLDLPEEMLRKTIAAVHQVSEGILALPQKPPKPPPKAGLSN